MNPSPTIAVIGAGNMGSALIGGLIASQHLAAEIIASDPSTEKLQDLKQKFSIRVTHDNKEAIKNADVVLLAVKPQFALEIVTDLAPLIQSYKPLVLSILAGVREKKLQQWLGGKIAIVRTMPNTPALIGCGATALYANSFTSAEQCTLADSILHSVGITVWLEDEKQLDAVTALSGSGPAYFFLLMEAMQQAGQELGLSEDVSRLLTLHTAYGSSVLAAESKETIEGLRARVTSPGGTTEAAVNVLEKGGLRKLMSKALKAASKRSVELGKL